MKLKIRTITAIIAVLFLVLNFAACGDGGGDDEPVYSVTYDANGSNSGNPPEDSNEYEEGSTVTVLGNTGSLGKTGYTFAGWNTAVDCSGTS
jgi:hypothetical protein